MSTDATSATTRRSEASAAVPGKSLWVLSGIAIVLTGYALATPWMYEWVWPAVVSGESRSIGATETEKTAAAGFSVWAGLFSVGVVGLLGLAVLARQTAPQHRSRMWILVAVALAVGTAGLVGAYLEIAGANHAAAEDYFGALSGQDWVDLVWGGAEAVPGNGLNNAVLALPFAAVPVTLVLGFDGPRLLAGLGAVLTLTSFAVPWRSATTLHADHLGYHDFWFTADAGKLAWLLLLGSVVFIAIVVAVFRARGAVQTLLGIASVIYFLALSLASLMANEYEPDEDRPIEASLADALHVHTRDPVWPEALTLHMAGAALLLGAALWGWRTRSRAAKR